MAVVYVTLYTLLIEKKQTHTAIVVIKRYKINIVKTQAFGVYIYFLYTDGFNNIRLSRICTLYLNVILSN